MLSTGNKSSMVRGLGNFEQFLDACTVHRNLNIGCAVTITTSKKFTFNDIEKALKRLQDEHLQLQACIKRGTEIPQKGWSLNPLKWFRAPIPIPKPEFWSLPEDKIKVPLQWIKVKDPNWLKDVLENSLQAIFEEGHLLWRAFWVEDMKSDSLGDCVKGTLVMTFHPAVTDLKGTFILLDEFFNHFDAILREESLPIMKEPKFHETVESKLENVESFNWREKLVAMKSMMFCMMGYKSPHFQSLPLVPDFTTRHISIDITAEESSRILKLVETNHTSLHALITASAAVAMHRIFKLNTTTTFNSIHEANLRLYSPDYNSTKGHIHGGFCNYIEEPIEVSPIESNEQFWNFVSYVHSKVVQKLRSEFPMRSVKFCSEMGSPYGFFNNFGTITNIRNEFAVAVNEDLDTLITQRPAIKMEKLLATVAAQNMGSPFHFMVNVFNKEIHYEMVYFGNCVREDQALEFGQKTLEIMKNYCN